MLGGGSNVVIADAGFPGLVVRVATRGVTAGPGAPGAPGARGARRAEAGGHGGNAGAEQDLHVTRRQ